MRRNDARLPSPEEAEFDELLRDFFAGEMPAEMRRFDGDAPEPHVRGNSVASPRGRHAAFVQLSAVALCLLLAGFALWVSTNRRNNPAPVDSIVDSHDAPAPDVMPNLAQHADRPAGFSLSEKVEPVESLTYDTINGPVQQRTNLKTTNVSFIEPGTGDLLELTVPELTIEIFPIDDARGPARNAEVKGPAEKQGDGGSPVLLPEQQSGLPPQL